MRHNKRTFKLNRNSAHRRCMVANMLKSLIVKGRIQTTVAKAKHLRRFADKMVTLGKKPNKLAAIREVKAYLQLRYNSLTPPEARAAREGDESAFNDDRRVLKRLLEEIVPTFAERQGGYTRIIRTGKRVGDNADMCVLEFVS